jgi:hypothetical protein
VSNQAATQSLRLSNKQIGSFENKGDSGQNSANYPDDFLFGALFFHNPGTEGS